MASLLPEPSTGPGPAIRALLILGPIIVAIGALAVWSRKDNRAAQLAAIEAAAQAPLEKHTYKNQLYGLAIAKDTVFIVERGRLGKIPLAAIRKAWWDIPGYDVVQIYGISFVGNIQAGLANDPARTAAKQRSGLYLAVADAERPLWFFQSTDAKLLRQWNEVLTQAFERANLAPRVG